MPRRRPAGAVAVGAERLELLEVLRRSAAWLRGRGVDSPRLDAELLIAHALGLERLDLYLQYARPLEPAELDRIRALVKRRGALEPVAHLVGHREFHSLSFEVTSAVLVPRPETEHLVEVAVEALRDRPAPVFADVGTGSGCVAVALLVEVPAARGHATDVSADALDVARRNAERHGVKDRLAFHEGDALAPLRNTADWGRLDAVVSNPPYVVRGDPTLQEDVRRWEPEAALYVPGRDPLEVARRVAREARDALRPGGVLALELGAGSGADARAMLDDLGYGDVRLEKDLAGIDRVLVGVRRDAGVSPGGVKNA